MKQINTRKHNETKIQKFSNFSFLIETLGPKKIKQLKGWVGRKLMYIIEICLPLKHSFVYHWNVIWKLMFKW